MFSAILSSYLFIQLNLNQLPLCQVAVTLNYKKNGLTRPLKRKFPFGFTGRLEFKICITNHILENNNRHHNAHKLLRYSYKAII